MGNDKMINMGLDFATKIIVLPDRGILSEGRE